MRKLLRYLSPHSLAIVGVLVLIFLQSMSTLYLPNLMQNVVDIGIVQGNIPYILHIGVLMLLVSVGGVACSITASYLSSDVSSSFGRTLRSLVFSKVEQFSLHEFDQLGAASLITRTTNDITQVQQLVNMMLRLMVLAPMTAIGGIIMAVTTDAKLSLIIVVVIPVLSIAIFLVMRRGVTLFRSMQKKIDRINRVLRESLTGVRVIRSFGRADYEEARFDAANRDLTDTAVQVNRLMALMMPLMMLIVNVSTVAILWFGAKQINHGAMLVGQLMAFIQYVMQILFAVLMVSMMFFMFPRATASADRIHEVLSVSPEIRDKETPSHSKRDGFVEFRDVTFSYPGAEQPALSHISFSARPGQITAIIGGTGAGKSTLMNLVPRFYDVDSGQVLVDGVDVRDYSQEELRSKIGYVPGNTVLFSGSVADNIRYGRPDATLDEVRHAAEVAQAAEFIEALEGSYDARLAQGGQNLSGGQRQRLSIARALVRQPLVYILDDCFSALDYTTDAALRAGLRQETVGATVLMVAQRVGTVMDADQIVVIDEGTVAGIGTHNALLASCPVYREIVESQLGEGASA
ncbi:ABC transporter ATP-binding protein [Alicyclobacillus sp. ALC3]|uniref:ABC transporter ATP-binding protein n=1 Tax=Alicyclobacillus sp. ALC3 TaxID=2796143 RepID=UPI0023795E75|nr:ABC transporter ATP-binding protein [Alicyclobacillus sp. ALC3]WDL96047.1 ABC transporter ATP-binding protein [Alicyclobacillus sp. ALC3]